jgi:alpha-glucoside transport system permease protein
MSTATADTAAAPAASAATAASRARRNPEKLGTSIVKSAHSKPGKILVWMLALMWTIPTFGVFVSSFRPEVDVKTTGWWSFFVRPNFTLDNYGAVLSTQPGNDGLIHYLLNSFRITIPSVVISVGVATLAAYGFSWVSFKGRDWLYSFILSMLIVPLQMCLIPLLRFFTGGMHVGSVTVFPRVGFLTNSVASIWIAHSIFGLPFCIFLMKNFIGTLPREVIEAARVDGASHLTTFVKLVLPLSMPAIASVSIFQFVYIWNDYLVGFVFGSTENTPIIAKMAELTGTRGQQWHLLTAAGFVSMLVPVVVFLALQRFFVKGLLAGSVKG